MFFKDAFLGHRPSSFSKISPFVRAFITADSLMWSAINLSTPIFAIFVAEDVLGGNVETAAISFSVYYVVRVFAELITGRALQESSDARKLNAMVLGIIVTGISYLGFAYVSSLSLLYFFQGLSGIGLGTLAPPKYALFSTHLDKGRESSEWGLYDASVFIGMGFAAALGGFLAEQYGFKILFIVSAVVIWLTIIPYRLYFRGGRKAS